MKNEECKLDEDGIHVEHNKKCKKCGTLYIIEYPVFKVPNRLHLICDCGETLMDLENRREYL